jgi:hypothetical protein
MRTKVYPAAVLAICIVTSTLLAEEKTSTKLVWTTTADFYGKYVWRGQDISDNPVFQPSVAAAYGPLSGSVWSNMNLSSIHDNRDKFSEVDYTIDYTDAIPGVEGLKYSVGSIYYDFPTQRLSDGTHVPPTTEIYGGMSMAIPYLNPSFKIYRDVQTYNGTYYTIGIGHIFEKVQTWSDTCYSCLCFGASVGYGDATYNKAYWGYDSDAFNDLTVSVSYPITIDSWTVKPSLSYVTLLDGNLRDSDFYGQTSSDYLFAGLSFSTTF